jgi:hypothetical protein
MSCRWRGSTRSQPFLGGGTYHLMDRGGLGRSGRLDMHNFGLQTSRHLMYGGFRAVCKGGPLGVSLKRFDVLSLHLGANYVSAVPSGITAERAALRPVTGLIVGRLDV